MASYLGQERYGRYTFHFQATQCDDCGARGPESTRYDGPSLLPKGWTSELRGNLLVALCEKCQDDPDAPRCYVKGCGETENLEPCFVGEYVCPECKASQRHQRDVAGEFALEGAEG